MTLNAEREFLLDPGARLTGVATSNKRDRPGLCPILTQGANQCCAKPPNRGDVEREFAGLPSNTISPEQLCHHVDRYAAYEILCCSKR